MTVVATKWALTGQHDYDTLSGSPYQARIGLMSTTKQGQATVFFRLRQNGAFTAMLCAGSTFMKHAHALSAGLRALTDLVPGTLLNGLEKKLLPSPPSTSAFVMVRPLTHIGDTYLIQSNEWYGLPRVSMNHPQVFFIFQSKVYEGNYTGACRSILYEWTQQPLLHQQSPKVSANNSLLRG